MEDGTPTRTVVAAVADLVFGARIRAAAEQAGVACTFVRSAADLERHAAHADLVLLDSDARWLDVADAVGRLKAAGAPRVVVFGPHVAAAVLGAARTAGADRVLARSAFVKLLPDLLRG